MIIKSKKSFGTVYPEWTCKVCNWTWKPEKQRVRGQCGNWKGPGRKCPFVTPWTAEERAEKEKVSRARSEGAGKDREKDKEKEKEKQKEKDRGRSPGGAPAIRKNDKLKRQASRSLARSDAGSFKGEEAKSDPYTDLQAAPERHSERREQDAEMKHEQEDEGDSEDQRALLLADKKKAQRMLHQAKEEGYDSSTTYWEDYLTSINHQITELKPIKERKELFASRIAALEKDIEQLKEDREAKVKEFDKKICEKDEALARFRDLLVAVKQEEEAQAEPRWFLFTEATVGPDSSFSKVWRIRSFQEETEDTTWGDTGVVDLGFVTPRSIAGFQERLLVLNFSW